MSPIRYHVFGLHAKRMPVQNRYRHILLLFRYRVEVWFSGPIVANNTNPFPIIDDEVDVLEHIDWSKGAVNSFTLINSRPCSSPTSRCFWLVGRKITELRSTIPT